MRIGLMLRHLGRQPGGTGTYTSMMVQHMLALDRQNEYVLLYDDKSRLNAYPSYTNVRGVAIPSRFKLLWDQGIVPWVAYREKLDVVFNLKLSVPLLAPCRTAFVEHGADWLVMPEQYPRLDRLYRRLSVPLYWRKATRIIAISQDAQRRLANGMNRGTAAKLYTVYHGVDRRFRTNRDAAALAAFRRKYSIDFPFALYLGQIYKMKNVGNLIRAFARLGGRVPHKLLIVGRPGTRSEEDLGLIEKLGVGARVIRVGWVPDEDVPLFYSAADLLTFPSIYEGFGLPILEAMASGCPVVTSTGGACPEVAGDAALFVDPLNVDSISDGIYRGLTDRPLRAELVERGLARAREFTWERSAGQTIELLESMVTSAPTADHYHSRRDFSSWRRLLRRW